MHQHAPRPMGQHDTTELERLQRAERRAFYVVLAVSIATLLYVAANAADIARAVLS